MYTDKTFMCILEVLLLNAIYTIHLQTPVCLSAHSPVPGKPLWRIQRRYDPKHNLTVSLAQETPAHSEGTFVAMSQDCHCHHLHPPHGPSG